ncbi:MAG: RICIN domain-containing protein [Bacteroidota bacterium]
MPNGTLLLGADRSEGIPLYKSTNGGATWSNTNEDGEMAVPLPNPENGNEQVGNAFPIAMPNGDILIAYRYVNWHNYQEDVPDDIDFHNIDIAQSTDGGKTFHYLNSVISDSNSPTGNNSEPNEGAPEPFLYNGPDGKLWCLYSIQYTLKPDGTRDHPLWLAMKKSTDGGATWGEQSYIIGPDSHPEMTDWHAGMGSIVQADNGELIAVIESGYQSGDHIAMGIKLVRTADPTGESGWGPIEYVYNATEDLKPTSYVYGAGAPYIAKLNDGTLVVSYQVGDFDNGQKMGYVTSTDNGYSWSKNNYVFDEYGSLWSSLFVDSSGTLYGLTSGMKIKKHYPDGEPVYNGEPFYMFSAASDKVLGTAEATPENGSLVKLFANDNTANKQWILNDEGDGFFSLSPAGAPSKSLSVDSSAALSQKLYVEDDNGGEYQKWYVIEELGNFKIVNKKTGYVVDIWGNEDADGTQAVLWEDLAGKNQQFYALLESGVQLNVFDGYEKQPGYKFFSKKDPNAFLQATDRNPHNGTNVNIGKEPDHTNYWINQNWIIHRIDADYFWFESEGTPNQCLNVDYPFDPDGTNIHMWDYNGGNNCKWKLYNNDNNSDGYYSFINKRSDYVINAQGTDNGDNVFQTDYTGSDYQKWTPFPSQPYYPSDPLLGNLHPDRISLNQGAITVAGGDQTVESTTMLEVTSLKDAIGGGQLSYAWQLSYNNGDWTDIPEETETSYSFKAPTAGGIYQIHRTAIDQYYKISTNTITITVISNDATLSDLTVGGTTVTGFDSAVTIYDVVLPFGSTAIPPVLGTPNDNGANAVETTTATLPLPSTTVITVTAENGTVLTHTVNFTEADENANNDATLGDLMVNGESVAGFSADIFVYNIELVYGTTFDSVQVSAIAADANALSVDVTQVAELPGDASVTVKAEDAVSTQTYIIHFTVTAPSTDATLSTLTIDGIPVNGFTPAKTEYTVELPYGEINVPFIWAEANDQNATIDTTQAISLPGEATLVVTAEDGITTVTYTVYFTMAPNSDATLSSLSTKIYPNPVKDVLFIDGGNYDMLLLYTMTGQMVLRRDNNATNKVDLSGLNKGVYLLKLINDDTQINFNIVKH